MVAGFVASDRLAAEVDILDPDVRQRVEKSLSAPWNNLPLPDPLLKRIQTFAERVCFPLSALDKMPWRLKLTALALYMSRYEGLYPFFGIDVSLCRLAHSTGNPSCLWKILKNASGWMMHRITLFLLQEG